MPELPRPEVILTHESDLDGFVAGHLLQRLARHLFQQEVRLEAWNTAAWRQRAPRESSAWVTDLAFESRLDRPQWVVVDHHPGLAIPRQARLIHDAGKCAALLCYELCQAHGLGSPELERLVQLTNVGDLFLENDPRFEEAHDYGALLKSYSFWNLSRLLDGRLEALLDHPLLEVMRVRRRVEDPLGLAWSRDRITDITPTFGVVDVTVGSANRIVHELLRQPGCRHTVLATMLRKGSTGIVISLRSRQGEAQAIAQRLQGGGHPNAAGATLPRGIQGVPEAIDYLRQVFAPAPAALGSLLERPSGLGLEL